ncbi:small-conductance mechanosensitive channel [Agromyces terreus]|uniref:Small-conductance mechanosensitive channel n=1 Tax=Agromyces terreus TaxID=424795 RepID=A0A9X2KBS2_9MICO|nr:mechanosensitive ion channel domain-containing protein [Agromyces terreus]MCP2370646.1 small-conductance mechanosensitive channel [Agromyces terreus]
MQSLLEGHPWIGFAIAVAIVFLGVLAISAIASLIVRAIARRRDWAAILIERARWPFRSILLVVGLWIAVRVAFPEQESLPALEHLALILVIALGAWLVAQVFLFLADISVARYDVDVADNRVARRVRTQMQIVRRLVVVVIVVVAIGSILLTFDQVRAVGASVLASAGIASIVAGLAAQTVLANVFAGVQIAFSEAIRVDDVVVVDGEWGRIREITLTYVVVVTWDERTVVLPCTYFTTTPFENWTKYGSALIGAVEFDVDWRVSTDAMRAELDRVLAGSDLWDGRTSVLQVTEATGGFVRVRVLVSAADSAALWDLRCVARERLVEWVRETDADALPRQRVLIGDGRSAGDRATTDAATVGADGGDGGDGKRAADRGDRAVPARSDAPKTPHAEPERERAGLFSGTADAEERASSFTAAIPVQRPEDPADAERRTAHGPDGGDGA